jgi:hypothetical protein
VRVHLLLRLSVGECMRVLCAMHGNLMADRVSDKLSCTTCRTWCTAPCIFACVDNFVLDSVKRSNVVDASCVCCSVVIVVNIKCVVPVSADSHFVQMIFGLIGDIRRIGFSTLVNLILL